MLVTNREFWSSLPFDVKVELTDIIDEVSVYVNREANAINEQAKESIMATKQIELLQLNNDQRQQWQHAFDQFYDDYVKDIEPAIFLTAKNVNR